MAPRQGRPPKYDWDELTDGSIWKAIRTKDFTCTVSGFKSLLRYQAHKRGLQVEIHIKGPEVRFQFSRSG